MSVAKKIVSVVLGSVVAGLAIGGAGLAWERSQSFDFGKTGIGHSSHKAGLPLYTELDSESPKTKHEMGSIPTAMDSDYDPTRDRNSVRYIMSPSEVVKICDEAQKIWVNLENGVYGDRLADVSLDDMNNALKGVRQCAVQSQKTMGRNATDEQKALHKLLLEKAFQVEDAYWAVRDGN